MELIRRSVRTVPTNVYILQIAEHSNYNGLYRMLSNESTVHPMKLDRSQHLLRITLGQELIV